MRQTKDAQSNKGFTLVELVVVMTLLAILLAIGGMSMVAWQRATMTSRADSRAEVIFVAAQTKLTEMNVSGDLARVREDLLDSAKKSGKSTDEHPYGDFEIDLTKVVSPDYLGTEPGSGSAVDIRKLWGLDASDPLDAETKEKYTDSICHLRADYGDYDKYINNTLDLSDPHDLEAYYLFEIISEYIGDAEVLSGSISIEFSVTDGQVYSAFYSEMADGFDYASSSAERPDLYERSYSDRYDNILGYYGVSTLSHATKGSDRVGIDGGRLFLYNDDTARLSLALDTQKQVMESVQYDVKLSDFATKDTVMTFSINPKLTPVKERQKNINENLVDCEITRYEQRSVPSADQAKTVLGTYKIPVYFEDAEVEIEGETKTVRTLNIVLDAVDLNATSNQYLKDYATIVKKGDSNTDYINLAAAQTKFARTLSYYRFGLWSENLIGDITVTGDVLEGELNYTAEDLPKTDSEGAICFAKNGKEKIDKIDHVTYDIENCRHLYNIRFTADHDIPKESHVTSLTQTPIAYRLKKDIDWEKFSGEDGYVYLTGAGSLNSSLGTMSDVTVKDGRVVDAPFPSIRELRKNSIITGLDEDRKATISMGTIRTGITGQATQTYFYNEQSDNNLVWNHVVNGLRITNTMNAVSGIYDYNETAQGTVTVDGPTGFVCENLGEISYFSMDKFTVTGLDQVGAICGINRGKLSYTGTENTLDAEHKEASTVSGRNYVGGVFGFEGRTINNANKEVLKIELLTNNANVYGRLYVGGITGRLERGEDIPIYLPGNKDYTGDPAHDNTEFARVCMIECYNFGMVCALPFKNPDGLSGTAYDQARAAYSKSVRYIGGLVGYARNKNAPVYTTDSYPLQFSNMTFRRCMSYMRFRENYDTDAETLRIIKEATAVQKDGDNFTYTTWGDLFDPTNPNYPKYAEFRQLVNERSVGYYVGGCLGFTDRVETRELDASGRYYDPKTGTQVTLDDGVLFGDSFVGGFLGFNSGYNGCEHRCNRMTIMGNSYVGGMVGASARMDVYHEPDEKDVVELGSWHAKDDEETRYATENVRFRTYENCGDVICTGDYVGGACGYNGANLYEPICRAKADDDMQFYPHVVGRNYVGGSTGYNAGYIFCHLAENKHWHRAYVTGVNYVGGVAGYAAPESVTEGVPTKEGEVYGEKCFTGGYIGLNCSEDTYDGMKKYHPQHDSNGFGNAASYTHMTKVSGKYYVGGYCGGNIVRLTEDHNAKMRFDSPEATITGKAFVGGIVGYNMVTGADNDGIDAIANYLEQQGGQDLSTAAYNVDQMPILLATPENTHTLTFAGNLDNSHTLKYKSISYRSKDEGAIHVGGVLGYNEENSRVIVRDFNNENRIKIESLSATGITRDSSTDINGNPIKYAYAAYIIGRATPYMTIIDCRLESCGTLNTDATYHGSVTEVNSGLVTYTADGYIGAKDWNGAYKQYIHVPENTNYVGNIIGLNQGTFDHSNRKLNNIKLEGVGDVAGGLVAENGSNGLIKLTGTFTGPQITSSGRVVGSVCGINRGSIVATDGLLMVEGSNVSITGKDTVGALCGIWDSAEPLENLTIYAKGAQTAALPAIVATEGTCGAAIGKITSSATISNVTLMNNNPLNVTSNNSRTCKGRIVGGVVGEIETDAGENVTISGCTVRGNLAATESLGGVCGKVSGSGTVTLDNCVVGTNMTDSDTLTTAGIVADAGGITTIKRSRVYVNGIDYGINGGTAAEVSYCLDMGHRDNTGSCVASAATDPATGKQKISNVFYLAKQDYYDVAGATALTSDVATAFDGAPIAMDILTLSSNTYGFYFRADVEETPAAGGTDPATGGTDPATGGTDPATTPVTVTKTFDTGMSFTLDKSQNYANYNNKDFFNNQGYRKTYDTYERIFKAYMTSHGVMD